MGLVAHTWSWSILVPWVGGPCGTHMVLVHFGTLGHGPWGTHMVSLIEQGPAHTHITQVRTDNDVKNHFYSTLRSKSATKQKTFLWLYAKEMEACSDDLGKRQQAFAASKAQFIQQFEGAGGPAGICMLLPSSCHLPATYRHHSLHGWPTHPSPAHMAHTTCSHGAHTTSSHGTHTTSSHSTHTTCSPGIHTTCSPGIHTPLAAGNGPQLSSYEDSLVAISEGEWPPGLGQRVIPRAEGNAEGRG